MIRTPSPLSEGDTIGMICPAGYMPEEKTEACATRLREWGFAVKTGSTVGGNSRNYFSGTDKERLKDLQQMLDDDKISAIICARGGYGVSRIIDDIDFSAFRKNPKWIVGFSDITLLHLHICRNFEIATLHAPMANAFNDKEPNDPYLLSLKNVLLGHKIRYNAESHAFNRKGEAVGELIGGNLAMVVHSLGSNSEPKTKGRILFLEDVGEYRYNIDRMMHQLKRAGKLDKLAGLIIGGFTKTMDTDRPFGQEVEEIIRDIVSEYEYPVSFNFPTGHEERNLALKVGVGYKLQVKKTGVKLEE